MLRKLQDLGLLTLPKPLHAGHYQQKIREVPHSTEPVRDPLSAIRPIRLVETHSRTAQFPTPPSALSHKELLCPKWPIFIASGRKQPLTRPINCKPQTQKKPYNIIALCERTGWRTVCGLFFFSKQRDRQGAVQCAPASTPPPARKGGNSIPRA